jgi:hypothetical protein
VPSSPPFLEFCPPALTDAAGPLEVAHRLLRALSDDHSGVAGLCDSSPTPRVRQMVGRLLAVYAGTTYTLSVTAGDLAYNLRLAAETYQATEDATVQAAEAADEQVHRAAVR